MNERRFQGRNNDTGEAIGMPNAKATEVVKMLRRDGFPLARCSVQMLVKQKDGTWKIDVTCPALAVR